MSKPSQDQPENDAKQSTDRELWRERPDDYYADSLHVTATGGIGINCGGSVLVMPLRQWHALASSAPAPVTPPDVFHGFASHPAGMSCSICEAASKSEAPAPVYRVGENSADETDPHLRMMAAPAPVTVPADLRAALQQSVAEWRQKADECRKFAATAFGMGALASSASSGSAADILSGCADTVEAALASSGAAPPQPPIESTAPKELGFDAASKTAGWLRSYGFFVPESVLRTIFICERIAVVQEAPAPVTVPADPTAKLNQADVRLIAEHAMGEDDEAVENAGIRVMIALDGGIAHLKATAKPLDVAASGSQGEGVAQASSGNADYEPLVPLPGAAPTYEEGLQALAHAMRKLLPPALLAEVLSYLDPMTPFLDYVRTFRSGIPAGAAPPASSITAEAFREALISLREDLTCRHGYNHYCPNCDGSLDAEKILDRFKAIVYASPAPSAPPQEPKD